MSYATRHNYFLAYNGRVPNEIENESWWPQARSTGRSNFRLRYYRTEDAFGEKDRERDC